MTLVVELQCDDNQPDNSVVSLTRIRYQDQLLGLNRRDRLGAQLVGRIAICRRLGRKTCCRSIAAPRYLSLAQALKSSSICRPFSVFAALRASANNWCVPAFSCCWWCPWCLV